jgi:hypothetical protein
MSDLSALERRKYVRVADAFHAGYKAAETNQTLTLEFRRNYASSLEREHRLHAGTLLRFIEFESSAPTELEALPAYSERQKRIRNEKILSAAAPELIASLEPADDFSEEVIKNAKAACYDPAIWAEELAVAARQAVDMFEDQIHGDPKKKVSLWTICQRLADTKEYSYEKKSIFKAAELTRKNVGLELSFKPKGGRPTALNNEKGTAFVIFIKSEFEKADMVGQSAIRGKFFDSWVAKKHNEFYHPNLRVPAKEFQQLSPRVMAQIKAELKAIKCTVQYVSGRRLEAMGDVRNYVTWMIAATLGMKDVPLELRFNYDDTSIMFGDHNEVAGVAYTSEAVIKQLKLINRSVGVQRSEVGINALAACMVVLGMLASCIGLLHASIVKIYDRSIKPEDSMRLQFVNKVDACDIYVLYIRGKQKASGVVDHEEADDDGLDEMAHGGTHGLKCSDHASECEVAELVFNKVLGPKIATLKAEHFVKKKHIDAHGFNQKLDDVSLATAASAYIQEQQSKYDSLPAGSLGQDDNDDESCDANYDSGDCDLDDVAGEQIGDANEFADDEILDINYMDGLDYEVCSHLPPFCEFRGHVHKLTKCCDLEQRNLFTCEICAGKGTGVA